MSRAAADRLRHGRYVCDDVVVTALPAPSKGQGLDMTMVRAIARRRQLSVVEALTEACDL